MRWLRGVALAISVGSVAVACSSGQSVPAPSGEESTAQVAEALTSACSFDTIGLPCDPDGPAGPKLECEGMCTIAISGLVACQVAVAGSLNGVICGTSTGVGDAACKRYCSGKTCLAASAPQGSACRPTSKSTPCDGQCDGAGKCDNLGGAACNFGRDGQLCKFATCNFANASQCVTKNLAHNTLCSDNDACTIGKCGVTGICVKGPTVGCDDGNACTDDSCDPDNGGCFGTNDDTNACSDGNACFTGEHCTNGACVAGTVPVDCDDGNACTTDSCDPNIGCAHVAKSCSDGDACTQDVCAQADGTCSHPPVACSDGDACTDDSCDSGSGCVFAPKNCDDNDQCTADSCAAGVCGHTAVACDDSDDCTADACDAASGCSHTPIVGCGVPGIGGASGEAGAAGAAGAPDLPTAGAPGGGGDGPQGDAGQPATGGSATAGTAGTAGSNGGVGTSGSAGSSGNGTAGSVATGGVSGGTAGSSTGATATAGEAQGEAGTGGAAHSTDDGGCGCRTVGTPSRAPAGTLALALLGLTAFVRRRRRAA